MSSDQKKNLPSLLDKETVRDHLMGTYGLESSEADMILETYAKSLRENLQELQKAVGAQDGAGAASRAHALKGAFLNIGQTQLADTAHLLEKELPKKIEARHMTLVEQLIELLQPIIDTGIAAEMDIKS